MLVWVWALGLLYVRGGEVGVAGFGIHAAASRLCWHLLLGIGLLNADPSSGHDRIAHQRKSLLQAKLIARRQPAVDITSNSGSPRSAPMATVTLRTETWVAGKIMPTCIRWVIMPSWPWDMFCLSLQTRSGTRMCSSCP